MDHIRNLIGFFGVVTIFIYRALKNEPIIVYGDGTIIRDFIYIDDAIREILKIESDSSREKLYNIGSEYRASINELLNVLQKVLKIELDVVYKFS